jgi:putative ABC transport system substrate-binding protein
VRIEYRWSAGDAERIRRDAADLAALAPDVILTNGAAGVAPLLQATRAVPVVFVLVADPVGAGFVDSLAHPGGNATDFSALEYGLGGKWLELLKEIAPGLNPGERHDQVLRYKFCGSSRRRYRRRHVLHDGR